MFMEDVAREDVQRRARNVRDQARGLINSRSVDPTGELAGTVRFRTVKIPTGWAAQVGSDLERMLWFEEGTGVFGSHRTPIVPRTARYLRFQFRDGAVAFVTSVKGQPGKHPLRDSLAAARR